MSYDEIIAEVAEEVGLNRKLVDKIYRSYWRAVKEHITKLPLKKDMTEEEFSTLRPCVNIPSIGKLYVTYDRYKRIKKQNEHIRKLKEEKYATH